MNHDTALAAFVMMLAAAGIMLLILCVPTAASSICLTKAEARHLWPRQHLYWYSADHCWSNRRGPPRGIKLDPIIPNHARAEAAKESLPAPKIEAPLRSDQQLKIIKDGCCWPMFTEFDLRFVGVK